MRGGFSFVRRLVPIAVGSSFAARSIWRLDSPFPENTFNPRELKVDRPSDGLDAPLTRYTIAQAAEKVLGCVVQIQGVEVGFFSLYRAGSGFVIEQANGRTLVLTNYHVVGELDQVKVL